MTTLTQKLNEIRERMQKATPGPWDARCLDFSNSELPRNIWSEYGWIAKTENCNQVENADFIAHSRTDIELLLKIVERQARALDRIKIGRFLDADNIANICQAEVQKLLEGK